jgi:resuscitation-promoting factor RpfA
VTEIDPKLSHLYREAASEDPPAALDAAILAAARERVAKPHKRSQRRERWSRWMVPAGAIATLVLGVSIALLVEREQTIDDTTLRKIEPRLESPAPARVTEPAKPKATAAPEVAVKKEVPAAAMPAQAPVRRPAEPATSAADANQAEGRVNTTAPEMETGSTAARDAATSSPAAGAPAAPAVAARPAPMRQQATQRSPQAWLEEISRLKREGREKEVAEQLAEFRKAYPAYAVPEALSK